MQFIEEALHKMRTEPAFLKLNGKIMVAGDTHGDVFISKEIVKKFLEEDYDYLVFLGDYIDRAPQEVGSSAYNIDFLLEMKAKYPDKIYLLKGNHETNYAIPCYPHEFKDEVGEKYERYVEVFKEMPLAGMLNNVFVAHGGIFKGDLENMDKNDINAIEALTWSDPAIANLYRGAGIPFDYKDLEEFLKKLNAEAFIRGHDYNLNGIIVYKKCLTIFSSRLYKDMGNKGILIAKVNGKINSIDDISLEDFSEGRWRAYTPRKL